MKPKNPSLTLELLPYQKQFLKMLEDGKQVVMMSGRAAGKTQVAQLAAMMNGGEIPMVRGIPIGQFDLLTEQGWKLDLIRGVYVRHKTA